MKLTDLKDILSNLGLVNDYPGITTLSFGQRSNDHSTYISQLGSTFVYTDKSTDHKKKEQWEDNKKKSHSVQRFYLLGETGSSTFYTMLSSKGLKGDYILAIEPILSDPKVRTWTINVLNALLEAAKNDNEKLGIYRIYDKSLKSEWENSSFYAILIKVKDDRNSTEINDIPLRSYLASSDSRSFQGYNYEITVNAFSKPDTTLIPIDWPRNLLVFGAPGTGKSHMINKKIDELGPEHNSKRVTFYEDYSYDRFVGSYLPKQKNKNSTITGRHGDADINVNSESEGIAYEFVPGVFLKMTADAIFDYSFDKNSMHILVIEELNRANAASVFGDFFQLLDRNNKGLSEYEIALSAEMKDWFVNYISEKYAHVFEGQDMTDAEKSKQISIVRMDAENIAEHFRLPSNLYIWATMNSADQGVFPLDSAFKRRWSFIYKSVSEPRTDGKQICIMWKKNSDIEARPYYISWDKFRAALNRVMSSPENNIEEDRLIGPWYFKDHEFEQIEKYTKADKFDRLTLPNPLCDKLFNYIRQDVFRNNAEAVFKENCTALFKVRECMKDGYGLNEILRIALDDTELSEQILNDAKSTDTNNKTEEPAQV